MKRLVGEAFQVTNLRNVTREIRLRQRQRDRQTPSNIGEIFGILADILLQDERNPQRFMELLLEFGKNRYEAKRDGKRAPEIWASTAKVLAKKLLNLSTPK